MTIPFDLATLDTIRETESKPLPPRRERLWLAAGKQCYWCGCVTVLITEQRADQATIDHVIPEGKGGTNDESNVVSACFACNQRRNYEDAHGMAEGRLLGKRWSPRVLLTPVALLTQPAPAPAEPKVKTPTHVLITEQRDQALKEIARLRDQMVGLEERWQEEKAEREQLESTLKRMTFRRLLLIKIQRMLETEDEA